MITRLVAVIAVHAGVQALLVLHDPIPGTRWGFALVAGASLVALIIGLWAIAALVTDLSRLRLLVITAGVAVVAAAITVAFGLLAPFAVVIGLGLLGSATPAADLRRRPVAAVLAALDEQLTNGVPRKEAAKTIALRSGWDRREVYRLSLSLP